MAIHPADGSLTAEPTEHMQSHHIHKDNQELPQLIAALSSRLSEVERKLQHVHLQDPKSSATSRERPEDSRTRESRTVDVRKYKFETILDTEFKNFSKWVDAVNLMTHAFAPIEFTRYGQVLFKGFCAPSNESKLVQILLSNMSVTAKDKVVTNLRNRNSRFSLDDGGIYTVPLTELWDTICSFATPLTIRDMCNLAKKRQEFIKTDCVISAVKGEPGLVDVCSMLDGYLDFEDQCGSDYLGCLLLEYPEGAQATIKQLETDDRGRHNPHLAFRPGYFTVVNIAEATRRVPREIRDKITHTSTWEGRRALKRIYCDH